MRAALHENCPTGPWSSKKIPFYQRAIIKWCFKRAEPYLTSLWTPCRGFVMTVKSTQQCICVTSLFGHLFRLQTALTVLYHAFHPYISQLQWLNIHTLLTLINYLIERLSPFFLCFYFQVVHVSSQLVHTCVFNTCKLLQKFWLILLLHFSLKLKFHLNYLFLNLTLQVTSHILSKNRL